MASTNHSDATGSARTKDKTCSSTTTATTAIATLVPCRCCDERRNCRPTVHASQVLLRNLGTKVPPRCRAVPGWADRKTQFAPAVVPDPGRTKCRSFTNCTHQKSFNLLFRFWAGIRDERRLPLKPLPNIM